LLGSRLRGGRLLSLGQRRQAGKGQRGENEGGESLISHRVECLHTLIPLDGGDCGPLTGSGHPGTSADQKPTPPAHGNKTTPKALQEAKSAIHWEWRNEREGSNVAAERLHCLGEKGSGADRAGRFRYALSGIRPLEQACQRRRQRRHWPTAGVGRLALAE
jgi:hypothetical protein